MKIKLALGMLLALIATSFIAVLPNMVKSSIPSIYYVTPAAKIYENTVNCTGAIQSENVYEVYAPVSFVAGDVIAEVGSIVAKGETMLTVDSEKTEKLAESTINSMVANISENAQTADISALISSFGLGDIIGGFNMGSIADAVNGEIYKENTKTVTADINEKDIQSPAFGVVTAVNTASQNTVLAGSMLFTVQDIKNFKVLATVSEADISKIQVGDRAVVRGVGFAGASFEGEVVKIHPTARKILAGTNADTVVDVEIKILSPNNKLKHGFSARVEITGDKDYELITVPYEAIRQNERNEEYVYTYDDGKLKKTLIVTGKELINEVEILDGLKTDSIVIFNPDDVPGEGAIVNIKGRAENA